MIKKLSFKFILVFSLLVVSIFITSSCYALSQFTVSNMDSSPYTLEEVNQMLIDNGRSEFVNCKKVIYDSAGYFYVYAFSNENILYLQENSSSTNCINFIDSSGNIIQSDVLYFYLRSNGSVLQNSISEGTNNFYFSTYNSNVLFYCNYDLYNKSGELVYSADTLKSVKVTHEFQSDTSAKVNFDYSSYGTDYILQYSLSGVEVNVDLTAPVKLRNPVTYSPRSNKLSC